MKYAVVLRAPSLQRVMGPDCFWFLANIVDKCILRLIIEVVGLILIHSKEGFFGDGTLTSGSKITTLEKCLRWTAGVKLMDNYTSQCGVLRREPAVLIEILAVVGVVVFGW
jgi:hypothetical protein